MSDALAQDRIELDVQDFGPIVEASLDLRPLTVFIGPSNTGKSWLATLIYALHRRFGDEAGPEHWRASPSSPMLRNGEAREPLQEEIKTFVQAAGLKLFLGGGPGSDRGIDLTGSLLDAIRTLFGTRGALFGQEIGRCLGLDDAGALSRRGCGADARIVLRRRLAGDPAPRDQELTLGVRGTDLKDVVPDPLRISNDELNDITEDFLKRMGRGILEAIVSEDEQSDFFNRGVISILEKLIRNRVAGFLTFPAHYLPANRTGVLQLKTDPSGGKIAKSPWKMRLDPASSSISRRHECIGVGCGARITRQPGLQAWTASTRRRLCRRSDGLHAGAGEQAAVDPGCRHRRGWDGTDLRARCGGGQVREASASTQSSRSVSVAQSTIQSLTSAR